MLSTFRGEFTLKIDAKGRVSIPADFRKVLDAGDAERPAGDDPKLIIVYGDGSRPYLEGYSVEAMARVDAKLKAMKSGKTKKVLTRFFLQQSWQTPVDTTGRIVLPKGLRERIELDGAGELFFGGSGETFQIWNEADRAEKDDGLTLEDLDDFEDGMDAADLLDLGG